VKTGVEVKSDDGQIKSNYNLELRSVPKPKVSSDSILTAQSMIEGSSVELPSVLPVQSMDKNSSVEFASAGMNSSVESASAGLDSDNNDMLTVAAYSIPVLVMAAIFYALFKRFGGKKV
jgi:hypothetical protein